jgi:hypothetical protein
MPRRPSAHPTLTFSLTLALALAATGLAGCVTADEPTVTAERLELGRPPVAGSFAGWTLRTQVEPGHVRGAVRATVTFDDNGLGGLRSGGACLVADLGLGGCETNQDCVDAAVARGLPGNLGTAGWFHYCLAAGSGDASHADGRRCWSRPGTQAKLCQLGPNGRPGDIRGVEQRVTGLAGLDDEPRAWTAIGCLTGGTAADGSLVGDPLGCAHQAGYIYAVDHPVLVP